MQTKTIDLLRVDFDFLNRFYERFQNEMVSLAWSAFQIKLSKSKLKRSKNSIDARFAARFGSPPRIRLQGVKLNRWEQNQRNEKIFTAYCAALNAVLGRPATQGEIFGYEKVKVAKNFVDHEK